jgi:hypothetical protein
VMSSGTASFIGVWPGLSTCWSACPIRKLVANITKKKTVANLIFPWGSFIFHDLAVFEDVPASVRKKRTEEAATAMKLALLIKKSSRVSGSEGFVSRAPYRM